MIEHQSQRDAVTPDEQRRLMADLEIAQRRDLLAAGPGDGAARPRRWRRRLRRPARHGR
jgi:hypothetical protein